MGNYNPNIECTCGLEWFPFQDSVAFFGSDLQTAAATLVASTNDEFDQLYVSTCGQFGPSDTALAVEIFNVSGESVGETIFPEMTDVTTSIFRPARDVFNIGAWGFGVFSGFAVTQSGIYRAINNAGLFPGTWPNTGQPTDDIEFMFPLFGTGYQYGTKVAGISGTMTNRWVTSIKVKATVDELVYEKVVGAMTISPGLYIGGKWYWGPSTTVSGSHAGGVEIEGTWWANPLSGLPWTNKDLSKFDSVSFPNPEWGIGWKVEPTGSANNLAVIYKGWLEVNSAPTDQRAAIGAAKFPFKQGWQSMFLVDGNGNETSVTLTENNKYMFLFRRTAGWWPIALCRTDQPGVNLPGPPFWTSYEPRIDYDTRRVVDVKSEKSIVYGVTLSMGGAPSMDSQPYITTSPTRGAVDAWNFIGQFFNNSPVYKGHSIKQSFTPEMTADYAWLYIMAAWQVAAGVEDNLYVTIKRTSDNAVMMGPFIFSGIEELIPDRTRWQKMGQRVAGDPVTLDAGTEYYFWVTSETRKRAAWNVQVANGGIGVPPNAPPAGSSAVTYGGSDHLFTISQASGGSPSYPNMDAEITINTIPPAIEDFVAEGHGEACGIDWVDLSWTSAAATWTLEELSQCGGLFGTEIQRSDDGGDTWFPIALIHDSTVVSFRDFESIRNVEASYRMRNYRYDRVPSDWTEVVTATATQSRCGLLFTSNEAPDDTVFYSDLGTERTFSFPEVREVKQLHFRDKQMVFRELEDRGTTFNATLNIRSGRGAGACAVTNPCLDFTRSGIGVFDPLKTLCRADLSYVCVHNEVGDRFFASVGTPSGTWKQPAQIYKMSVEVVEVTNTPSQPDAAGTGS